MKGRRAYVFRQGEELIGHVYLLVAAAISTDIKLQVGLSFEAVYCVCVLIVCDLELLNLILCCRVNIIFLVSKSVTSKNGRCCCYYARDTWGE